MSFNFYYKVPNVVAEIGCNHMGDINIAKELIDLAKLSGARYVKFQKRNNKELLTKEQYNEPHTVSSNSYGSTYGEHREFLEFSVDQNKELKDYCDSIGMVFSTSVWDVTSAKEMIPLGLKFLKVPSACNNNFKLLRILRDEYQGQVQLSVGMTTKDEIESIVNFFEKKGESKSRLLLYSCTSGYPVPPKDVSLLEINWLYDNYGSRVSEIGFSGHHLGISLDISAYTLGARWIERHFTKDRSWKGTDHAASLEPSGLRKLIRDLNSVYEALNYKNSDILPIEKKQRKKLKNRK
jgi:N-acetylneuraminate synthase